MAASVQSDPMEPRPQRIKVKLADGKVRQLQSMVATTFWSADGKPMSAAQFLESLFGALPEFFRDEDQLREIWSDPSTRKALLDGLADKGFGREALAEMQKAIEMLAEVKESIINAYEIKTGLGRGKLSNLMDAESWMNAKKAVELGFADSILFDGNTADEQTDEIEAMMFSRAAVTNSLLNKFKKPEPDNRVDAGLLKKRLFLIAH